MLDAKAEVDARLRQAINEFTGQFVARMTAGIDTKGKTGPGKFAAGEAASRTAKVRQIVERETPFLRSKLEEYVEDTRTREMLVAAVMESVMQAYEDWFDSTYTPSLQTNGAGKSRFGGKGKGREDDVWDPDMFNEWCAGVFKVGTLGLGIMAEEPEDMGLGMGDDSDADSVGGVSGRSGTERTGTTGIRIKM